MEHLNIYLLVLSPILLLIFLEILWTALKNAIKRGTEQGIYNAYQKLKKENEIEYLLKEINKFKNENKNNSSEDFKANV